MTIAHDVAWPIIQQSSGTSIATASHTPAANTLIVGALLLPSAKTLTSIVDSAGATVNILPAFGPASGGTFNTNIYIFYVKNAAAVARTFTANFGATTPASIMADSFTGIGLNNPFDRSVGAAVTGSPINTGNTSTTQKPNELLVGYASVDSNTSVTWTGATGYGGLGNVGTNGGTFLSMVGSSQIVSATGAYSYQPQYTGGSLPGVAALVTFADSDITGATVTPLGMLMGVGV